MSDTLFHIENLKCSYDQHKIVLNIERLDIKRGTLNFIIGASGIGKSTFIETIGLMNNTIYKNGQNTQLDFQHDDKKTCLTDIWNDDSEALAQFRSDNYSFIFQSTNLMSHFTAGENMCFGLLLNGKSMEESKKIVLEMMASVNLNPELFDRKIVELSGGQRQRVAFVRAFASDFEVLFCDEPTGNLDVKTAHKLMSNLKQHLKDHNKTGLIVSHDINLALKFADNIYYIKENNDNQELSGELSNEQCFSRQDDDWYYKGDMVSPKINSLIDQFV